MGPDREIRSSTITRLDKASHKTPNIPEPIDYIALAKKFALEGDYAIVISMRTHHPELKQLSEAEQRAMLIEAYRTKIEKLREWGGVFIDLIPHCERVAKELENPPEKTSLDEQIAVLEPDRSQAHYPERRFRRR